MGAGESSDSTRTAGSLTRGTTPRRRMASGRRSHRGCVRDGLRGPGHSPRPLPPHRPICSPTSLAQRSPQHERHAVALLCGECQCLGTPQPPGHARPPHHKKFLSCGKTTEPAPWPALGAPHSAPPLVQPLRPRVEPPGRRGAAVVMPTSTSLSASHASRRWPTPDAVDGRPNTDDLRCSAACLSRLPTHELETPSSLTYSLNSPSPMRSS